MSIARQPLSARCRQGRGQGDAMAQSGRRTAQRGAAPWLTRLPFSAHSARGAVATAISRCPKLILFILPCGRPPYVYFVLAPPDPKGNSAVSPLAFF